MDIISAGIGTVSHIKLDDERRQAAFMLTTATGSRLMVTTCGLEQYRIMSSLPAGAKILAMGHLYNMGHDLAGLEAEIIQPMAHLDRIATTTLIEVAAQWLHAGIRNGVNGERNRASRVYAKQYG